VNRFRIRAKVEGLAEFTAGLQQLKQGVRNRVLRKMVNAGTQPVLRAARERARQVGKSGVLGWAMVRKVKTYKRAVVGIVGAGKGKEKTVSVWSWWESRKGRVKRYVQRRTVPGNILHLVEKGTKPHALGKGSKLSRRLKVGMTTAVQHGRMHPGSKAQPVLEEAWEVSKRAAKSEMVSKGIEGLKAEVAKLRRKR